MHCHLVHTNGKPCINLTTYQGCYVYCNKHKYLIDKDSALKIQDLAKRLDSYDEESLYDLINTYDSIFNFKLKHMKKNGIKSQ